MARSIPKPLVLVIMDGWGVGDPGPYNAASLGRTPELDRLMRTRPHTTLLAHGRAVGLPDGQMGNSEVGHLNLGAGRVVKQDLVVINDAIEDGSFAANPVFLEAADKIKAAGGTAHLMGLCSPGEVHSSLNHLFALTDLLADRGIKVRIHAITDGRDTPPKSARGYLAEIERRIAGKAEVAVVVGRFYSMDRDNRWDRIAIGYAAHTQGQGRSHRSVDEAIAAAYEAGETDEFITPRIIVDENGSPKGVIRDLDGVFFFNFRADRAREMTAALTEEAFDSFRRPVCPRLSSYVCMTEYRKESSLPTAFPPRDLRRILGQVLSERGLKQFRAAETEKYAHVTFFFNGGLEAPFENEERKLVPSPKEVPTYDQKPEMSAAEVCDAVLDRIASGAYDFILVNFANGDMVGHTGVLDAAIRAAEAVDREIGRIASAVAARGGALIVTADHGNLEKMWDAESGEPHTAHTNGPVPFILADDAHADAALRTDGALCDVAPTILAILDIRKPPEMTGRSLIEPA